MTTRSILFGLGALVGLATCTGNIADTTVQLPSSTVEVTTSADLQNVAPGESIPVTINVTNVYLVDPAAIPPAIHALDSGYLVFTLDDESATPLLVTSLTNVTLVIPPGTPVGSHTIICRLYDHDGTPTDVVFKIDFTVTTSAVPNADAGTGTDASFAKPQPPPPPAPTY